LLSHRLALPVSVACLAAALFAVTLRHGMVLDSVQVLRYNEFLQDPGTGPLDLWRHGYWHGLPGTVSRGNYRPLTVTTLWLFPRVGLEAPAFQHALNVLLHALATSAVAALLLEVGLSRSLAAAAAVWFAVHPVHTEPVSYVVGRAEVMMALFAFLALRLHVRAARADPGRRRAALLAGAVALGFLAMASKENGVAVVALVPVVEGWMIAAGRPPRWRGRVRWIAWSLWLTPLLITLLIRRAVFGTILTPVEGMLVSELDGLALWPRTLFALSVLGEAWRVCLPVAHLSADYGFPQIGVPRALLDKEVLEGLMGLALLACLPGILPSRHSARAPAIALLGAAWFALTWLPTSHLVFVAGEPFAERWLYLPSLGLIVWAVALIHGAVGERRVRLGVVAAVALVMTMSTGWHLPKWRDPYSITRATALASPQSWRALYNAATEALFAREYAEALGWYQLYFALADPRDQHWRAALNNRRIAQAAERVHRLTGEHPELPPELHFTRFQPVVVPPRGQATDSSETPDDP
jgi:hypothetical protein